MEPRQHHAKARHQRARTTLVGIAIATLLPGLAACAASPTATRSRTLSAASADCSVPSSTPIPDLIEAVFACELRARSVPAPEIQRATAEADRVAWCESRYQADAVVFDGKYVNTPNPATGYRYSAAGVFQIIRNTADAYVPGGYAAVLDPVANVRGAARIWHWGYERDRDPWAPWVCKPGSSAERAAAAQR